jgi:transmembrane sensor
VDNINKIIPAKQIAIEASDWMARMDADTKLTQQELAELKQWMNRSPAHRAQLNSLIAFWQEANALTGLSFPLQHKQSAANRHQPQSQDWQRSGAFAFVVIVAVMLSIHAWWFDSASQNQPRVSGNGVYETRVGEQNSITLVDGSVIELNTNSRLQVNYTDQHRAIKLMQGEAFFDVSKDPNRPFEVAAGSGVVRAVGTAFAVHFNQEVLTVTVTEGKVALAAAPPKEQPQAMTTSVGALVAGQSAQFAPLLAQALETSTKTLETKALNQALAWREGLLMFSGESLATVVKEMNRYTALTIEIADPSITDLQVGGQFSVGETENMLENLSISFDLDILQVNEHLVQLVKK